MEERVYQGFIYRRAGPGEAWQLIGPAPASQSRGRVIADPYRAAEESRKNQDQAFEAERLRLAQEAEARARAAEERANAAADRDAEKAARDREAVEARGGVETTEAERTAAFLATRLAGGLANLSRIGDIGAPSLKDALVGGTLLGNYATEEDRQRTINAQREILDSALTLGTGAAYTKEQIDSYRAAYFPQPGDKPGTIADKQARLRVALEAARLKAGASSGMIDEALARVGLNSAPSAADAARKAQALFSQGASREEILAAVPSVNVADLDAALARRGSGEMPRFVGVPEAPAANEQGSASDYADSYLGQGLSGVNEGVASTLGLPVDAAAWAMNLVPQGINAVANTAIPEIEDPLLGSNWWTDVLTGTGSILPESQDPGQQFVRRAGQSVGSAAIPVGATANTARQAGGALLSALGGGIGGATAQQIAPDNIIAEILAETAGGGLTGAGMLAAGRRNARREIEAAVPTVDELKEKAGDLYRAAEASGVTADPPLTQQLADAMRATLVAEGRVSPTGRVSEVYPKVKEAMQLADDYAGNQMNPTQMQTVRSVVADGMNSPDASERRIASLLLDDFDSWANPLAPELADARNVASRYLNAQKLEQAREMAGARAGQFSGSGFENALRTEYRALDRATIKGRERFHDPVVEAIQDVSRGTPASNAARAVGRLYPNTPWNFTMSTALPATAGTLLAGPWGGAAATLGVNLLGGVGRKAATNMGVRNAEIAELIARNGGSLPEPNYITDDIATLLAATASTQAGQYLER